MKRICLEHAALPDVPMSQLTPQQQIVAKIAWLGDNAEHGITDACCKLIDEVKASVIPLHWRPAAERIVSAVDKNNEYERGQQAIMLLQTLLGR